MIRENKPAPMWAVNDGDNGIEITMAAADATVTITVAPAGASTWALRSAGEAVDGNIPDNVMGAIYAATLRYFSVSARKFSQHKLLSFMILHDLDSVYEVRGPGGGVTFGSRTLDSQWRRYEPRMPRVDAVYHAVENGFLSYSGHAPDMPAERTYKYAITKRGRRL